MFFPQLGFLRKDLWGKLLLLSCGVRGPESTEVMMDLLELERLIQRNSGGNSRLYSQNVGKITGSTQCDYIKEGHCFFKKSFIFTEKETLYIPISKTRFKVWDIHGWLLLCFGNLRFVRTHEILIKVL